LEVIGHNRESSLICHINTTWPLIYLTYPACGCSILHVSNRSLNLLVCFNHHHSPPPRSCLLNVGCRAYCGSTNTALVEPSPRWALYVFFLHLLTYRHLSLPAFVLHIFAVADFINPSAHLEYHGPAHRATIPAPSNHKTTLHLSSSVAAHVKLGSLVKDAFLANSSSRH